MATDLLLAADLVKSAAALPTDRKGTILPARPVDNALIPGWSVFEAQARSIRVDELRWPWSVRTYEDMTRDPQIQGLLLSVFLPLRHMQWYLDPNGAPATLVEEIAEDFGLALDGEETPEDSTTLDFDDHLRLALLALAGGHKFFEESGVIEGNGPNAKYRLRRLDEYPNELIQRISVTPSGDLDSIRVYSRDPAVDGPFVDLNADRLLAYVWDRRGADWAGRPLLYGLYRAWLLKDEALRGNSVTLRRFSGIPYMETTQPGVVSDQAHKDGAAFMQALRAGDTAGFSVPYGQKPHIMGVEGQLPDAIKTIEYLDQQMARAFMQMFAELGNTRNGSRALGTTLLDHYALGVLAVAKWIRKTQMGLVRRIAVRNYGPDVVLPRIRCRQDDNEDMPLGDLVALIDSGAIVVDDDLEAQIRDRGNLVARNPSEAGRTPPSSGLKLPVSTASRREPATAAKHGADLSELQSEFEDALNKLKTAWTGDQNAQIDDLERQVAEASTVAALAALVVPGSSGAVLLPALNDLIAHGAQSVVDEAAAAGHEMAIIDLTTVTAEIADAADATAALAAASLTQSAASFAVGIHGPDSDPAETAKAVRIHLEGLTGSDVDYQLAGLATRAQNQARFAMLDHAPAGTRFIADEQNDAHTCELCRDENGSEFESMAEARRDYPSGGFIGCLGGLRCRGTLRPEFPDAPTQ